LTTLAKHNATRKRCLSNPQIDIWNTVLERVLFMSGVGGGKTFILANKALKYIKKFPNVIGFIGANTYSQLSIIKIHFKKMF
jgi:hypothetical protein